jgi:regulator of replication initiation timing
MDEGINSMVETIKELEAENEKLKFRLSNVSGSYVVFEDSQEQEGLVTCC